MTQKWKVGIKLREMAAVAEHLAGVGTPEFHALASPDMRANPVTRRLEIGRSYARSFLEKEVRQLLFRLGAGLSPDPRFSVDDQNQLATSNPDHQYEPEFHLSHLLSFAGSLIRLGLFIPPQ